MRVSIFIFLALTVFTGCNRDDCAEAQGDRWSHNRQVNSFHTIDLAMSADAYIEVDTTLDLPEVSLVSQGNIADLIDTKVDNGILRLEQNDCIDNNSGIEFYIRTPFLQTVIASSTGDIYTTSIITQDSLSIFNTSNGDIDLTLNVNRLYTSAANVGDITLNGFVDKMELSVEGSGDFYGEQLPVNKAQVVLNGSGNATVRVENELNIIINSRGNLYYYGIPQITAEINGSGDLINSN